MTLKAVLFDFNGVIINDEAIHQQLISEILLGENLRPSVDEYKEVCLGRSDRAALQEILAHRGRIVTDEYLNKLIQKKSEAYQQRLATLEQLPLYTGIKELLQNLQMLELPLGLVSGALRSEIEYVLDRVELASYFDIIVAGDEVTHSKPNPESYLLAVDKLNQQQPSLQLHPTSCLAIEDTPAGIKAAKRAGMQVVGISHTYPLHMLQRQANWCIDYFSDLEIERVQSIFAQV